MKKLNHISWSFGLSLWIFYFIFHYNLFETIVLSLIVSLIAWLPDIDLKIIKTSQKIVLKTFFLFYPIHLFIKILFKHRTITHSIWIPAILLFLRNFTNILLIQNIFLVVSIAILLHIFEDSLTISGVQPFFPIPFKIRLWNFNTSSKIQSLILELIADIIIILFIIKILIN